MQQSDVVPTLLTVEEAARLLGIGRTLAYRLIREDAWPTPVVRAGRLIKIPSAPMVTLLETGISTRGDLPAPARRAS